MSDPPASPKSGTPAAFTQRHEAYALARNGPDVVDAAKSALYDGYTRAAAADLGDWLNSISKNPEALRMVEACAPGLVKEAQGVKAEADRTIKETPSFQIRAIGIGGWRMSMDGFTETRLSFGKSRTGHHYMLEASTYNREPDSGWSTPFRTDKAARAAGQAAEDWALGEQAPRPRDGVQQTPRGRHAELLQEAAGLRRFASNEDPEDRDGREAAQLKQTVRNTLQEAAEVRECSMEQGLARTAARGYPQVHEQHRAVARAVTVRRSSMEEAVASASATRTPEAQSERRRSRGMER